MTGQTQGCTPRSELYRRSVFAGFPYLVSRPYPALYHIIVLPADRREEELLGLAERQVTANRLETFLALGHRQGMNYGCDGVGSPDSHLPRCTAFVCDKLQPAEDFPQTPELVARIGRLHVYIDALHLKSFLIPDSRRWERPGAPEELAELTGFGSSRRAAGPRALLGLRRTERGLQERGYRGQHRHGLLPLRQPQPVRALRRAARRPSPERLLLRRGKAPDLPQPGIRRPGPSLSRRGRSN